MNDEHALRLAEKWSRGYVCSLRDGEAQEYHKACAAALRERIERNKGCEYCKADRDGFVRKIGAFALSYTAGEHKTYLYAHGCKQREINFCPMCGRPLKGAQDERG